MADLGHPMDVHVVKLCSSSGARLRPRVLKLRGFRRSQKSDWPPRQQRREADLLRSMARRTTLSFQTCRGAGPGVECWASRESPRVTILGLISGDLTTPVGAGGLRTLA